MTSPRLIIEQKIKNFIKSELEKKNITKNLSFTNWHDIKDLNPMQKECINSISCFFYFINSPKILILLDKFEEVIIKNWISLNKGNPFKISNLNIDNTIFWIVIFLYKSFSLLSPMYKNNFGDYKNSDRILDNAVNYIAKYNIYYNIESMGNKLIRTFFLKVITCLKENSLIMEEERISITSEHSFFSKFWKLDLEFNASICYENFYFSYIKFEIIDFENDKYLKGLFFWNVFNIYSKNFESNEKFKITNDKYLNLLNSLKLFIDNENKSWILEEVKKEFMIYSFIKLDELSKEMIEITKKENWNIKTDNKLKELQKLYSKKIEFQNLINFLNIPFSDDENIYFPFFFDFRGRKYFYSPIGPTQSKITRFIFHYGYYQSDEFTNFHKIKEIWDYSNEIIKNCIRWKINYDNHLESIFWVLIGIGKHFIKKSEVYINTETFLKNAIYYIDNQNIDEKMKLLERIELKHYISILKSLDNEKIKKRLIPKDGTASGYQISMILLYPKSQNSLKYVNLFNKHEWIDTYSFIIDMFIKKLLFKKNVVEIANMEKIVKREITKSALMTIPYSIGFEKCYDNFKEKVLEHYNEYIIDENVRNMFKDFYGFAKTKIEKQVLYEQTTKNYCKNIIEDFKINRNIYKITPTGQSNLKYMVMLDKPIDVILNLEDKNGKKIYKRLTKQFKIPSESINVKQTKISIGANLRHFLEAEILRTTELKLNKPLISIHDAELIDFNDCSRLIIIKNEIFQELIDKYKIWSLYIYI